jgi:hypothetical protein
MIVASYMPLCDPVVPSRAGIVNLWYVCPKWYPERLPRHAAFTGVPIFFLLLCIYIHMYVTAYRLFMLYRCYQTILPVENLFTNREQCAVLTGFLSLGCQPGGDWANTWQWTKRFTKECPNKNARFKGCTTVVLLGWRHWKFNICHLSLLWLVVMECCTKEQRIIIVKTRYKYGENYVETVRKVSSHAMAIRTDYWGRAIWHRATSFFGSLWNLVSMPTNHKLFLSSRRRFDGSLAKLSRNYAEMSSRI